MLEMVLFIVAKYILGFLLQSVIFVLALYAFSKKKIDVKPFIYVTLVITVCTWIIREFFPIDTMVHTPLILIILLVLNNFYLKLPVSKSVFASLFCAILLLLFEFATGIIMVIRLGEEQAKVFIDNPFNFALVALPGGILMFLIVLFIYRKEIKKNVPLKLETER